uniref:G-protein coupled receptors family 1 profile domain-containing protein n=1 Tax=Globodera rostochiensis TaxID=31243 RepID=A0A914GVJ9_GLORO
MQYQTSCFDNSSVWPVRRKEDDRERALRTYQGWLLLPFVTAALPLSSLYIIASIRAIRARSVSRKFSALLVNRALGDLFASFVSFIAVLYLLSVSHISVHWVTLLNSFFTSCFWSALVTYTSIGLLKLYGIARPFQYKEVATMERCVMLIKLSWACFALIMFFTMGFTLIVKIEFLANLTGCKVENCLSWMYRVRNIFTILLYITTLICFVLTVMLIKKAKRRSGTLRAGTLNSEQQRCFKRRYQFPLVKLSLGVGTFAVFHLPYTLWMIALVFADNCYFIRHYNLMQMSLGFIRLFVLIRIILDALIGFYMDGELKREIVQLLRFGVASKPARTSAMKLSTTTNSGVISSESMPDNVAAGIEMNRTKINAADANKARQQQKKPLSVKIAPKTEDKMGEAQRRRHSEKWESVQMEERRPKKY